MDVSIRLKKGGKTPIKQGISCHPLREGKGRKEERGQRSKKHNHFYTVGLGP